MEAIVLNRLTYFSEKHNIIPTNQAGFRKGRSTTDHLVKLTTQIKRQFARRQNVLATFFDISKAYDQVWHERLLYKLKSIGLSGHIYNFVKTFLTNRTIQTRVGNTYSSKRQLDMGIPQGSVIAPILFNILTHDLPKFISKHCSLIQYADDICLWMNATLKKNTPKRTIHYVRKTYQNDINNIAKFMSENGLTLSPEKSHMMLFDAGGFLGNAPT